MRFISSVLAAAAWLAVVRAQTPGTLTAEYHMPMSLTTCSAVGSCTQEQLSVTLDSNWRWYHNNGGYTNCYQGNAWNSQYCPDPTSCVNNCQLEGIGSGDWGSTYGIKSTGSGIQLGFVTQGAYSKNVGGRVFMLDSTQSKYQIFKLKNREFTFDVDASTLPCGLNGALYFVEMDADGGSSKYPTNKAGAKYGTGYCDAQCPHDIKYIHGEPNLLNWAPSASDPNAGVGQYGSCCTEMDIWEANSISTAYTAHPCSVGANYRCTGIECGDDASGDRMLGVCDKDGCDINTFRLGDKNFYGPGSGFSVDSTKPVTVVTQFITNDGTDTGNLTEIKRFWVQNGKVIDTPTADVTGLPTYNSIKDETCAAQKNVFGETNTFAKKGGLSAVGEALDRGLVLVMSIWDDHAVNMLWLDSDYPTTKDPASPGVGRGTCSTSSGVPSAVEESNPGAYVKYSNVKVGAIGSTFSASGSTPAPSSSSTPATSAPTASTSCSNQVYDQCGGQSFLGATCCPSGSKCSVQNQYYSQCVPSATA